MTHDLDFEEFWAQLPYPDRNGEVFLTLGGEPLNSEEMEDIFNLVLFYIRSKE